MAQEVLPPPGMLTTSQGLSNPVAHAIYSHETTQLSAVALALVGFVDRARLGPRAAAQRRDLKSCASKTRLHVGNAGSAGNVQRRRTWYQRAQEHVASFAFALLDLQQGEQIGQDDFEAGRRLAAHAKALLDAQLGALKTVAPDEQEDADKLDQVMLAADRAASTAPPLVSGAPAAAAAPPSPASSSAGARQGPSGDAVPAPKGSVVGRNGGPTLATLAIAGPDRRSRRSTRPTTS